jgi:hypothetical protein
MAEAKAANILSWGKSLPRSLEPKRQQGAREALLCLTFINLLNFADRYVPAAVKELVKADLDLTDTESALPTTVSPSHYIQYCEIFRPLIVALRGWFSSTCSPLLALRTLMTVLNWTDEQCWRQAWRSGHWQLHSLVLHKI